MKRQNGIVRFQIATKENGYITELDPGLEALILDLADKVVDRTYREEHLCQDLKSRLKPVRQKWTAVLSKDRRKTRS